MKRLLATSFVAIIVCFAATACRHDEPRGQLEPTVVPCVVPRGVKACDCGCPPEDEELRGHYACGGALIAWLRANPHERVAGIVPIDYPPAVLPTYDWRAGTMELLVIHTAGSGPWPSADELDPQAFPKTCAAEAPHGYTWGPSACIATVDVELAADRESHETTAFWVPMTSYDLNPGTNSILSVHRRIGGSYHECWSGAPATTAGGASESREFTQP